MFYLTIKAYKKKISDVNDYIDCQLIMALVNKNST